MKYKVERNGLVQGGEAEYTFDPSTGDLSYSASIQVGVWFLHKTESTSGKVSVPASLLKSDRIKQPGQIISDGDFRLEITAVFAGGAAIAISKLSDADLVGSGTIDLTGEYINPKSITIHDVVAGIHLTIGLTEVM